MECKITKIVRELPLTNIPKTIKNTKNKKPEIFKEMQNHKDYEGTASDKHTKKIKNQKFFMKCKITKILRVLPPTNIPNNIFIIWKAKPKQL